jgi:hypothetical protein
MIKGYEQMEDVDYDETYAPVSKTSTFQLILAFVAQHGWNVDDMDMVTVFLNPTIDRDNIHKANSLARTRYNRIQVSHPSQHAIQTEASIPALV